METTIVTQTVTPEDVMYVTNIFMKALDEKGGHIPTAAVYFASIALAVWIAHRTQDGFELVGYAKTVSDFIATLTADVEGSRVN